MTSEPERAPVQRPDLSTPGGMAAGTAGYTGEQRFSRSQALGAPSLVAAIPIGAALVLSHIPHALIWTGFCLLTPVVLWLTIWLLDAGREPGNETAHESGTDDEEPDGLLAAA